MQVQFTLDTTQPGDLIALQQIAAVLSGSTPIAAPVAAAAAEPEAPRQDKPVKEKPVKDKPATSGLPNGGEEKPTKERTTLNDLRNACAGRDIPSCQAVIKSFGAPKLAEIKEEDFDAVLAELKKLPLVNA